MADATHIEWTDATWNPVTGCSVVSPGCTNCYAMKLAGTRLKHTPSRKGLTTDTKAGPVWNGKVRRNGAMMLQPLKWRRPRKIFVCAHGDLFHEDVPDAWIDEVFAIMCLAPHHTFQVLTKRAARMRAYFAARWQPAPAHDVDLGHGEVLHVPAETHGDDRWSQIDAAIDDVTLRMPHLFDQDRFWTADGSLIGRPAWPRRPLPNVWLGVSAEDQTRAVERIPDLLRTPAAVRFLSAEPLLGELDLESLCDGHSFWDALGGLRFHDAPEGEAGYSEIHPALDWVIVGGESGPGARPMHPDWARRLRNRCRNNGVAFFFKQWGEFGPAFDANLRPTGLPWSGAAQAAVAAGTATLEQATRRFGKKAAGRRLDGVEHNDMPNG